MESIVHLESGPILTNGSVLRWDPDEGGEAQLQRRQKDIQPILRTLKAVMKVILQYLCLVNKMTCPKMNFSVLRSLRMQNGGHDHVMP